MNIIQQMPDIVLHADIKPIVDDSAIIVHPVSETESREWIDLYRQNFYARICTGITR